MRNWKTRAVSGAAILFGVGWLLLSSIVSVRALKDEEPNRINIEYVPTEKAEFQEVYGLLKEVRALEKLQEIYSPFLLPEVLTFKTKDCGTIDAWYIREAGKPTITLCYDLLNHILQTVPKEPTPEGVTERNARVGQSFWFASHEAGLAMFDIFNVPVWGHEQDAADGFAGFILLHLGKDQSKRLINGAAWQWRDYISDYRSNRDVQLRLAGFASNHGRPEQRFYDLMCMAYGADPVTFSNLTDHGYLPPTRAPSCKYEYRTLAYAFKRNIVPHLDYDMAKSIWDMEWIPEGGDPRPRPPVSGQ